VLARAASDLPATNGTAFKLTISREIKNGPPITLEFRGTAADGLGRLDIIGGTDAKNFPAGSYVLVSDTSGAATMVLTAEKTIRPMLSGARLGGLVELYTPRGQLSDVTVRLDDLGPGEAVDGHPTRRYRITSAFTLTVTIKGKAAPGRSHRVLELWQAQLPVRIPNPFAGLGGDDSTPDPLQELNAKVREVGMRLPGVTIRSQAKATLSAAGVAFTNQLVTTLVSEIRDAEVDKRTLEMPAGYAVQR
jgi:hypothetical protein